MTVLVPPIATLTSDLDGDRVPSVNQEFPVSSARDEPSGTKPLLEPSSVPSTPPKRGTTSRPRNTRSLAKFANIPAQDNSSSSYHHQVLEKAQVKRKKIQVERSFRVLRPRGCQPSVTQEISDGGTRSSAMQLIQDDKENHGSEIPDLEASWDKWRHVRGTIRRPK